MRNITTISLILISSAFAFAGKTTTPVLGSTTKTINLGTIGATSTSVKSTSNVSNLSGVKTLGNFGGITVGTQSLPKAPEPITMSLAVAGLGLAAKRKFKKSA